MTEALLALGGNVGDSRAILDCAVALLCDGKTVRLTRARPTTARRPGASNTSRPSSTCASRSTRRLGPSELLARAQAVELQLGRDRAHEKRNGPRTADIDIIAYGDETLDTASLKLPHPRLFERAFVLVPLAEIAPERAIAGRKIKEAAGPRRSGIERCRRASGRPPTGLATRGAMAVRGGAKINSRCLIIDSLPGRLPPPQKGRNSFNLLTRPFLSFSTDD